MASDAFTNSDGTSLPTHDAKWTTGPQNDFEINSNQAEATAKWSNSTNHYSDSQSEDQESEIVFVGKASVGATRGVAVRQTDTQYGYDARLVDASGGNWTGLNVYRDNIIEASATGLSYATASNHTVRITVAGNSTATINVYVDGNRDINDHVDSTPLTGGYPGFRYYGVAEGPDPFDDWTDNIAGGISMPVVFHHRQRI
jgi:hypothetical protein